MINHYYEAAYHYIIAIKAAYHQPSLVVVNLFVQSLELIN